MSIEWHQKEEFVASRDGHFIIVQPMVMGPGYSANMRHLNDEAEVETVIIPAPNEEGELTTGAPFWSVDKAKEAAELFLTNHLATPPEQREVRLLEMMKPKVGRKI